MQEQIRSCLTCKKAKKTVILLLFLSIGSMAELSAQTYWTNGDGSDNNWSTPGNWSTNVVPSLVTDEVVFDAAHSVDDCTIDVDVSVKSVVLQASYTGTVTFAASTFTVADDLEVNAGRFNGGNSGDLVVGKNLRMNGGIFTASTQTTRISGGYLSNTAFFQKNGGEIILVNAGSLALTLDKTLEVTDLTFNGYDGVITGTVNVLGTLELIDGTINTGSITLPGDFTHHSGFNGSTNSGEVSVTSTTGKTLAWQKGTMPKMVIESGSDATIQGPSVTDNLVDNVITALELNGGTFDAQGHDFSITDFLQTGGVFNGNASATEITIASAQITGGTFNAPQVLKIETSFDIDNAASFAHGNFKVKTSTNSNTRFDLVANVNFYDFEIDGGAELEVVDQDVVVTHDLLLTRGTIIGNTLEAQGGITHSASFFGGTGTFNITSTSNETIQWVNSGKFPKVTLASGTNATLVGPTVSSAAHNMEELVVQSGTFQGSTSTIKFNEDVSVSGGTFTVSSVTTFDQNIAVTGGAFNVSANSLIYGNFEQNGGVSTVSGSATIDLRGTFTLFSGTFNATAAAELQLGGNTTLSNGTFQAAPTIDFNKSLNFTVNSAATFTHNNGLVKATGTSLTLDVPSTGFSLYDLEINFAVSGNRFQISGGDQSLQVDNHLYLNKGRISDGDLVLKGGLTMGTEFNGSVSDGTLVIDSGISITLNTSSKFPQFELNNAAAVINAPASGTSFITGSGLVTDGAIVVNGGGIELEVNDLTMNGGTLSGTGAYRSRRVIVNNGGTFNAPAGSVIWKKLEVNNGGVFNGGSSIVTLGGNSEFNTGANVTLPDNTGRLNVDQTLSFTTPLTFDHNNGTVSFTNIESTASFHNSRLTFVNNVVGLYNLVVEKQDDDMNLTITDGLLVEGDLTIDTGYLSSNSAIELKGNLDINHAATASNAPWKEISTTASLTFSGTGLQTFSSDNGTETFFHLIVNNTGDGVSSEAAMVVTRDITMTQGDLNINAHEIDLGTIGEVIGEANDRRIYGTTGSGIRASGVNLLATNKEYADIRGLGLTITTGGFVPGTSGLFRGTSPVTSNGNQGVARYYELTPANSGNLDVDIEFSYFDNELNGLDEAVLELWSFTTDDSDYRMMTNNRTRDVSANIITVDDLYEMNSITLGTLEVSLPVTLLYFNATAAEDGVHIKWSTASEQNNDFFSVERSQNGTDWTIIQDMKGAGSSALTRQYETWDRQAPSGRVYYRLGQSDLNGAKSFSEIVSVEIDQDFGSDLSIRIFPNPVAQYMTADLGRQVDSIELIIMDVGGLPRLTQKFRSTQTIRLDTSGLPGGLYLALFRSDGQSFTKKIIKQ